MLKQTGFFKIALEMIILEKFNKFNIQIYLFRGLTYCHISDCTGYKIYIQELHISIINISLEIKIPE